MEDLTLEYLESNRVIEFDFKRNENTNKFRRELGSLQYFEVCDIGSNSAVFHTKDGVLYGDNYEKLIQPYLKHIDVIMRKYELKDLTKMSDDMVNELIEMLNGSIICLYFENETDGLFEIIKITSSYTMYVYKPKSCLKLCNKYKDRIRKVKNV